MTTRRFTALCAATLLAGCAEIGAPGVPASVGVREPAWPAIELGDWSRDSLGQPAPLPVTVLDSRGEPVEGAAVEWLLRDTVPGGFAVSVDPVTGLLRGVRTGFVRVQPLVGGILGPVLTLRVVHRAERVAPVGALHDTVKFRRFADTLRVLRVRVDADTSPAVSSDPLGPGPGYLVRFDMVQPVLTGPADTTRVYLADETSRRASRVDTSGTDGMAARAIRLPPNASATLVSGDSVVVDVTVLRPDRSAVPGSPIRFVVVFVEQ